MYSLRFILNSLLTQKSPVIPKISVHSATDPFPNHSVLSVRWWAKYKVHKESNQEIFKWQKNANHFFSISNIFQTHLSITFLSTKGREILPYNGTRVITAMAHPYRSDTDVTLTLPAGKPPLSCKDSAVYVRENCHIRGQHYPSACPVRSGKSAVATACLQPFASSNYWSQVSLIPVTGLLDRTKHSK